MRIKVSQEIYAEMQRQKAMLPHEFTDEEFLALVLEARAIIMDKLAVDKINKTMKGSDHGSH